MDVHDDDYVRLDASQERFLAILPIPSAILSVLGSSIIIKMAMHTYKKKKWTPYTRLLVAMSLYDIQTSITFAAATFLRPHDTSHRLWAFGDDATCSTIGFFNTIGSSSFFYNGMLSFYFLLRTKFGFSNQRMATKVEPIMHGVAIGYPLLCAILGLLLNLFGELTSGLSCWIKDVPFNCGTGEGRSGEFCYSQIFAWLFYAIPTFVALVCLSVNSIVLLHFIWKHTRPAPTDGIVNSSSRHKFSSRMEVKVPDGSSCNSTHNQINSSGELDANKDSASTTSSCNSKEDADGESILLDDKYEDTEAIQQRRRMKLLGSQAFLFVACYILCNVWTGIMLLEESNAQTQKEEDAMMVQNYSIAILQAFFYPLQGFCNMLIYLRPRYLSMRYGMPNESRFSVAKLAVLGEDNLDPNNNANESPSPSNPTTRKGLTTPTSVVNANNKETSSSEQKQRALDAANNAADQEVISSAKPLPRNMISSLTASFEESPPENSDNNNDTRWGKAEQVMDSNPKPRKSAARSFQSSLRPSQLEVISELSESVFESVISGPDLPIPEPVSPNRSSDCRWGTSISSDLPPTLDISDRTMRISNRFNSSSEVRPNDAPVTAPFRQQSEHDGAILSDSQYSSWESSDFSVISEQSGQSESSSRSVDLPIRPPTRRLSPTPPSPPSF